MKSLAQQLGSPAVRYRTPLHSQPRRGRSVVFPTATPTDQQVPDETSRVTRRRRLEAVLLLAREALPLRRLAQLSNLTDGTEARTLIGELQTAYRNRRGALIITQVAGGYRLMTRPALAPWIERFASPQPEQLLTSPVAETLAIVAYRQPVVRAEIEAIRGAQSGELLRQLMQRGLLRIVGRSEELGRPILYGTSKQFLQEYGLKNLDELPPVDDQPAGVQPAEGQPVDGQAARPTAA